METSSKQKVVLPLTTLNYDLPLYHTFLTSYNMGVLYVHIPSLNVMHSQCNGDRLAYSL